MTTNIQRFLALGFSLVLPPAVVRDMVNDGVDDAQGYGVHKPEPFVRGEAA